MARNRKQPDPDPGQPTIPPEKGIELIQRQIEAANALLNGSLALDSPTYQSWENVTSSYLEKAFGTHSPNVTKFTSHGKYGSFPINAGAAWWAARRAQNVQGQLVLLAGFVDLLSTEIELSEPVSNSIPSTGHSKSRKVFVVHGHDTGLKQAVARFLEKLDLEPVILDEQPNQGRTIFKKFSDHSDVAFAIVLLTSDDVGGKRGTPPEKLSPRARQNVILEFGYFLGKFGPAAVCALYEPGVELPSDVSGMLYIPVEDGVGWMLKVATELKAAGIDVDLNRIF
jgi:predicted nucleotide-binding protein